MLTVLTNARIYTLDPIQPVVSSITIQGDRILSLGDDQPVSPELSSMSRLLDLSGRTVLPGLMDAHLHLENFALSLAKIDCETTTFSECLRRISDRLKVARPGEWVLGHGWNQNEWLDHPSFPTAAELDAISPHNPVYLTAKSLHAAWANSLALKRSDIDSATVDPPGGRLGRDLDGIPDGILFEEAMQLVSRAIPEPDLEQVVQAIQSAQMNLLQMGVTGVHDFDRRRCFQALQILHSRRDLRLRVVKSLPLDDLPYAVGLGLRTGFGDDFLRIGSIKAFSDGALGPRTAAMLAPYEGEPDNRGILLLDAEELADRGRPAVENGLSLAVHAIGDRANHEVLNAFQQLRRFERGASSTTAGPSTPPLRHRIEHVQIVHPDDVLRLSELDVIASMQPIHATSDYVGADRYWGIRAVNAYAWRTLLAAGTRLAFGSDAPVDSPNPFWGLHAAITRRRQDGSPGPQGWYPDQRLELEQALQPYTTGAAYAAGMEDRLGRLSPGFLADLIVLEEDPFQVEADRLYTMQPVSTMVAGEWVVGEFA
jgi:predicted amidohydrolase YtcJ